LIDIPNPGMIVPTAQRELARLENSGLLVSRRVGHQKHYQANTASPLFAELRSIVLKTVALAEPLRTALKPLSSSIRAAFVYGSVAKATDRATSDIDLMIVSDSLTYGDVFGVLARVTKTLGRQVNPTVYRPKGFAKRARSENAFMTRVLEQPKIWIIGVENDITGARERALARLREGLDLRWAPAPSRDDLHER
jgi:predicted nucleotidyltransferase